jgi:hypothetical protein
MQRLPRRAEGYTLDLDSTVFERYGQQEGSLKGHNPRKHGVPASWNPNGPARILCWRTCGAASTNGIPSTAT